jgi:chromosome segregation ATPase
MGNEFNALENKIVQVTSLCRDLRSENNRLRQQLAVAEADKHELTERMETVRGRIGQLVQQLPEAKA